MLALSPESSQAIHDVLLPWVPLAFVIALLLLVAVEWLSYRGRMSRFSEVTAADVDDSAARVFLELADAEQIVNAAVELFHDPERWIHRRVERIAFTGQSVIRRHVSIDFHIPPHAVLMSSGASAAAREVVGTPVAPAAHALTPGGRSTVDPAETDDADSNAPEENDLDTVQPPAARKYRLVPISLLRSWPPVLSFDLRDHRGAALTLFSKSVSSYLDLEVLRKLARSTLGATVAQTIDFALTNVTHAEGQQSRDGAQFIEDTITEWLEQGGRPPAGRDAATQFTDLCLALCESTLLWVAVEGEPLDRVLVKLAYDQPLNRRLTWWRRPLTALGWATEVTHIQVPHIGTAGSYHLQIAVPEPIQVVRARLRTVDDEAPSRRDDLVAVVRQLERRMAELFADLFHQKPPPPEPVDTSRLDRVLTNHAYLYRGPGQRSGADAMAELKIRVARRAQPRTHLIVAAVVALGMTGLDAIANDLVVGKPLAATFGATVGVLLVAPGLVAYIVSRSGEHPMATMMLSISRSLSMFALAIPVLAAAALIAAAERNRPELATDAIDWLTRAAWALAAILLLGWLLPAFSSRHRDD